MKDKNFEPLKIFLKEYYLELTELHEANINVSNSGEFFLYNYNQVVLVPRDDEIIRFCRGLVLRQDGSVANYPFRRFFNFHEKECDKIDFESSDILEKLDGSLISVWWTGLEWEVTTRGSFYPNEGNLNFKEVFKRLFNKFNRLEQGFSYMFELISKDNRIVTKYDTERVVLIGARDLSTSKESTQDELDASSLILQVDRPRRYKATSVDECRTLFESMKDDEEGLVIVDKNFNRMKLKQESYLKMSRIMSMKNQDILDYVLGKTELDADFEEMEELKEKIKYIAMMYENVEYNALLEYSLIKNIESQKDFAEKAKKSKLSSIVFKLRQGKSMSDLNIRYDRLNEMYEAIK